LCAAASSDSSNLNVGCLGVGIGVSNIFIIVGMNQLGWPVSNNEIYLMELFVSLKFAFENCIVQFLKAYHLL
jgi:23S rRNA A1618 N6-methylase RlmF